VSLAGDAAAGDRLPLSALLSQALVAFTIEFDNAAELQLPHRTSRHGSTAGGVWLVSMAMWLNCMRYVGAEPITAGEVARLARADTNLDGMRRWGYVTVTADPEDRRSRPPNDDLVLQATKNGMRAAAIWEPLTAVMEQRWRDRFGAADIDRLRAALASLAGRLGSWLPDCLPILGYGLYSRGKGPGADRYRAVAAAAREQAAEAAGAEAVSALALPWLLARVLLALAIAYERESKVSLAIAANLLRVLDERGVQVRGLPALSGVSKEGLAMAAGITERAELTCIGPDPGGGARWKLARLTPKGGLVRDAYFDRLASLEARWVDRFGADVMADLRESLERLVGPGGPPSPLFAGLEPQPGNWRADVAPPQTLPHFPMVLHRGGYPDGA
jgi:hypothetical protein